MQWTPFLDPHLYIVSNDSPDICFYIRGGKSIFLKGNFDHLQLSCFTARADHIEQGKPHRLVKEIPRLKAEDKMAQIG